MSSTMELKEAMAFMRERFGRKWRFEFITTEDGMVTGHVFQVGRHKHVEGFHIKRFDMTLWADGVEYAQRKVVRKRTAKRRSEIVKRLAEMSSNGWQDAAPAEYAALERELSAIDGERVV